MHSNGLGHLPFKFEEYVHALGDDHLDPDAALRKARTAKKEEKEERKREKEREKERERKRREAATEREKKKRQEKADRLAAQIEEAEARIARIDGAFGAPGYYEETPAEEVEERRAEREKLQRKIEHLMGKWEDVRGEGDGGGGRRRVRLAGSGWGSRRGDGAFEGMRGKLRLVRFGWG